MSRFQEALDLIEKTFEEYGAKNKDEGADKDENTGKHEGVDGDAFLFSRKAYLLLHFKKDFARAQKAAQRAAVLDHKLPSPRFYLARALQLQNEHHKAVKEFAKAVGIQKNPEFYYYWAESCIALQKIAKAKWCLQQANLCNPSPQLRKKVVALLDEVNKR